jgi:hypothetical protein
MIYCGAAPDYCKDDIDVNYVSLTSGVDELYSRRLSQPRTKVRNPVTICSIPFPWRVTTPS